MIKDKLYYEFLKPDFVYIPFNDRTLLNIKLNMNVYANKLLGKLSSGENIYSTCSGKIIDLKEIDTVNGKINSMVIENDFREKRSKLTGMRRNLQTYKKEELLEKLEEYSLNYFNDVKNLIVLIEYTKNIDNSDSYTLKENIDEILETLDALQTILNIDLTIVVNTKDETSLSILYEHIGTYPNIYLDTVSKEYSKESYPNLIKRIYNKEDKTIVLPLDIIYEIFYAIKKNKNLTNKVITLSHNNNLININVKIGTKVKELLNYLNISSTKVFLFKNELKSVNAEEAVITKDLKSICIK